MARGGRRIAGTARCRPSSRRGGLQDVRQCSGCLRALSSWCQKLPPRSSAALGLRSPHMGEGFIDPPADVAIKFAEMIAKSHAARGGDPIDLLATFVGMVIQEDEAVAMRCLQTFDLLVCGQSTFLPHPPC